jgi:hypothetical protein
MQTLLAVTALVEAVAGLALLAYPPIAVQLIFTGNLMGNGIAMSRVGGAALLAIGVACWLGRSDARSPAELGLLAGVLTYDLTVAAILACYGLFGSNAGIALWPAVAAHAALGVWSLACIRHCPRGGAV